MESLKRDLIFIIGVGLWVITLYVISEYTSLFENSCPSIYNRVCNNQGICDTNIGLCVSCNPLFSGDICQNTKIPGYNKVTGEMCSGRGVGSPFMTIDDLFPSCREQLPTRGNGFKRIGLGWLDLNCTNTINMYNEILTSSSNNNMMEIILSEPWLTSLPYCVCIPPYGGPSCELLMCPEDADFNICSNHGNISVGLIYNNTKHGTGCQCTNYLTTVNTFPLLTTDQINFILDDYNYYNTFTSGFCGLMIPTGNNNNYYVYQSQDYFHCYCEERYYGVACELGVCPTSALDVICNGNGHPSFGFGIEYNTSYTDTNCLPICVDEKMIVCGHTSTCMLPDVCAKGLYGTICPSTSPYRCSTGDCVTGNTQRCDLQQTGNYESGTYDNLSSLLPGLSCSKTTIYQNKKLSYAKQQTMLRQCFGSSSYLGIKGFISNGQIILQDDVYFLYITLLVLSPASPTTSYFGSLQILYGGRNLTYPIDLTNPIPEFYISLLETELQYEERKYYETNITVIIQQSNKNPSLFQIIPDFPPYSSTTKTYFKIRTIDDISIVVNVTERGYNIISPTLALVTKSAVAMVNITSNTFLTINNQIVTLDDCLRTLYGLCFWSLNLTSITTTPIYYVCSSLVYPYFYSSNIKCNNYQNDTMSYTKFFIIQPYLLVIPRIYKPQIYLGSSILWTVLLPTPLNPLYFSNLQYSIT